MAYHQTKQTFVKRILRKDSSDSFVFVARVRYRAKASSIESCANSYSEYSRNDPAIKSEHESVMIESMNNLSLPMLVDRQERSHHQR
jgi:hypothetical protein